MKLLLFVLLFSSWAHATNWESYVEEKRALLMHERHLPYQLNHGHKTAKSVLLIHGIYSSPLYFKGMADAFFKAGHNVVTIILPGHFEKDWYSIDQVANQQWVAEADRGYQFARELGDKVILAGHSLGGVLSIEQALKRPKEEVAGLVVLSPALKVWPVVLWACRAGRAVRLSGNTFSGKPDGVQVPYFSVEAGDLIQSLSDRVLAKKKIAVPIYMAYTWNDNVVDVPFVKSYYESITAPKMRRIYSITSGVAHGDISQGPTDVATFGNKLNKGLPALMTEAIEFIEQQN